MRRDTRAEIENHAIEMIASARRALAAALLQASNVRIAKIPAARTLGEVAAQRCKVTDLRRRKSLRACGKAGIGGDDARLRRNRRNRRTRADGGGAILIPGDRRIAFGQNIDQGALGDAAAAALAEVCAGGAELRRQTCCGHRAHAAALPLKAARMRSGRNGISVSRTPIALRTALAIAGEVGTVATSPMPTL